MNVFFKDEFDSFLNTLQAGDVILFKDESWISRSIQWFTDSDWNHVALYVGDGYIIEATEVGVEKNLLKKRLKHCVRMLSLRKDLNEEARKLIIDKAHALVYEGYDFVQFICLFLYFLLRKIGIRIRQLVLNKRTQMICSEVIYVCYLTAGIKLSEKPEIFTPQSIATLGFEPVSLIVIER
jgi:hypothetical protein